MSLTVTRDRMHAAPLTVEGFNPGMANRGIRAMLIQPPFLGGVRSWLPQVDEHGDALL